jgi:ketosteroid isomerase-like protein
MSNDRAIRDASAARDRATQDSATNDSATNDGAAREELVIRFFAALEAGDIETVHAIYAPDAVIWHNDDLIEQPVEDNLKVLRGLHRAAREALSG